MADLSKKAEQMRREYGTTRTLFIELGLTPKAARELRDLIWRKFHGLGQTGWIWTDRRASCKNTLAVLAYLSQRNSGTPRDRKAISQALDALGFYDAYPSPEHVLVAWDKLYSLGLAFRADGTPRGLAEVWARWQLLEIARAKAAA